jgi:hypothetical protein
MTLDELFADLATGLADETGPADGAGGAGLETVESPGGREWRREGMVFAVLHGRVAEFRLDPMLVGAALRTPDTRPSPRGPVWVAFEPGDLDDLALDRAEAWFVAAFRRAEPS